MAEVSPPGYSSFEPITPHDVPTFHDRNEMETDVSTIALIALLIEAEISFYRDLKFAESLQFADAISLSIKESQIEIEIKDDSEVADTVNEVEKENEEDDYLLALTEFAKEAHSANDGELSLPTDLLTTKLSLILFLCRNPHRSACSRIACSCRYRLFPRPSLRRKRISE